MKFPASSFIFLLSFVSGSSTDVPSVNRIGRSLSGTAPMMLRKRILESDSADSPSNSDSRRRHLGSNSVDSASDDSEESPSNSDSRRRHLGGNSVDSASDDSEDSPSNSDSRRRHLGSNSVDSASDDSADNPSNSDSRRN